MSPGNTFDLETAIALAAASASAYSATLPDDGHHWSIVANNGAENVWLFQRDADFLLAFRGTTPRELEDWIADGEIDLVTHPMFPGQISRGLADDFDKLWPFVSQVTKFFATRPVYIGGHSLGGIRATHHNHALQSIGVAVAPVYTFGSPRGGDSTFAHGYQPTQFRVIDSIDILPHLPTAFAHRHVGTAVTIENGKVQIGTSYMQSFASFLTRMQGDGILAAALESYSDHGIDRYQAALNRVQGPGDRGQKTAA